MLKKLFAFLLLLAPLTFGSFSRDLPQNNAVLHEKYIKKSVESDNFLSYWRNDFRKDENGKIIAICDITYASYKEMYQKYVLLTSDDRKIVNLTPDYEEGYTIEDSIKELIRIHSNHGNIKPVERRTLNQSSTIIIIVVVAVFGMSTICVFFVLKSNKIIQ